MKLALAAAFLFSPWASIRAQNMVKMCLFYNSPAGHARTDPIVSQECVSDHVHTFYGPLQLHANTFPQDLDNTPNDFNGSPFVENKSLYWHPTIYKVITNPNGSLTYERATIGLTSPYYRWDTTVSPQVEAFPPGFRMIASSDQVGASNGGETGTNLFTECLNERECTRSDGCQTQSFFFPQEACGEMGFAFAFPTCWNGGLGDEGDHKSHMAYTTDGTVAGPCPPGYNRRLPQVQLFIRIFNYEGGWYTFSNEADNVAIQGDERNSVFHMDFMNGWQGDTLANIIRDCEPSPHDVFTYNPDCGCEEFLTENQDVAPEICDAAVRALIVDEEIFSTNVLPRGTCQPEPNGNIISKRWTIAPPLAENSCTLTGTPPSPPPPTPSLPTPNPTPLSTPAPVPPTPSPPTPNPTPLSTPAPFPPNTCLEYDMECDSADTCCEGSCFDGFCDCRGPDEPCELEQDCCDDFMCVEGSCVGEGPEASCGNSIHEKFRAWSDDLDKMITRKCAWLTRSPNRPDEYCGQWDERSDEMEVWQVCPDQCPDFSGC